MSTIEERYTSPDSHCSVVPEVDHVDIYAIHVAKRVQRLLGRVTLDHGSFVVHAPGDMEKRILSRIESSTLAPMSLADLGHVFDAPQMMASRVHTAEGCAFWRSHSIELEERKPRLSLL